LLAKRPLTISLKLMWFLEATLPVNLKIWATRLDKAPHSRHKKRFEDGHRHPTCRRQIYRRRHCSHCTVTPGAAGVPTTGEDGTGTFLGLCHRNYSKDDITDDEQKKERNKKRRKTTSLLDRDNIPNQNVLLLLPSLFLFLHDSFICKLCGTSNHAESELESNCLSLPEAGIRGKGGGT
jgi:hypothetical protein